MVTVSNTVEKRAGNPRWFPVLMYHRVTAKPGPDPLGLNVAADELRSQMQWLKDRRYNVVPLGEAIDAAANGGPLKKQVALTFDDGYMDFYSVAVPILQEFGYPATAFLVSDRIGQTNTWDAGLAAEVPLMGVAEIREIRGLGFGCGSHSSTHRRLGRIDPEEAREEITASKKTLEDLLGEEVPLFCYPYGSSNRMVEDMVGEAGYSAALGIEQRRHALHNLSRIDPVATKENGFSRWFHMSGSYFRARRGAAFIKHLARLGS